MPLPPLEARAASLHLRARAAYAESKILSKLHGRLLDSFLDGALNVESAH
ncbi:hypothetical protein [Streptomyces sp. NPDC056255]